MSPKFRGDSDDWIDDSDSSNRSGRKPKKPAGSQATFLPKESSNATVAEVFAQQCRVKLDEDNREILCSYKRAAVIGTGRGEIRERSPVAVGDRVAARKISPDSGVVEGICERRNSLARQAPGRENKNLHHVIAANVDLLVIVVAVREPDFTPGLVDRYLIAAAASGIATLVCVTKIDLLPGNTPDEQAPWRIYRALGTEVHEISSKTRHGVAELSKELEGKTVVFCGKSGVGKTSLLRSLLERDIGRVGEVSDSTGKGRHTTTAAVLLGGPAHSQWIDTPGVREFALTNVKPETLSAFFPEFASLSCTAQGCSHLEEADCQARELPRYGSYRRIHESLTEN
ncbi:MAG: ribosome small subunit-dependent GTPase A [Bdellovibrionota bacterium]